MTTQWISLVLLLIGVALVQLAESEPDKTSAGREQNRWIGFGAAISACFLSGFAGIYFEKILKANFIILINKTKYLNQSPFFLSVSGIKCVRLDAQHSIELFIPAFWIVYMFPFRLEFHHCQGILFRI